LGPPQSTPGGKHAGKPNSQGMGPQGPNDQAPKTILFSRAFGVWWAPGLGNFFQTKNPATGSRQKKNDCPPSAKSTIFEFFRAFGFFPAPRKHPGGKAPDSAGHKAPPTIPPAPRPSTARFRGLDETRVFLGPENGWPEWARFLYGAELGGGR